MSSNIPIVRLVRTRSDDHGTFGRLLTDRIEGLALHSLELPWRENARRISCIPEGRYKCFIVRSPKFGHVYGVSNVVGRSHILMHAANLAGDDALGWDTQLHGCIAIGERVGVMKSRSGRNQSALLVSRPAVNRFMLAMKFEPFVLEISHV